MLYLLLILIEIISLYFISRRVVTGIYNFFYQVTKRKNLGMYIFAVLFLPGTFIHEISLFLAALFLLVPVGELHLIPRFKEEGGGMDLGSVAIAKTDPIRRFLIGVAPFMFGILIIFSLLYFVLMNRIISTVWEYALVGIVIFEVSNSMFASKKDLEGALALIIFIVFIIGVLYYVGVRVPIKINGLLFNNSAVEFYRNAALFLLIPIVIDSIVLISLKKV